MKRFTFIFLLIFTISGISYAQNTVQDSNPTASIFIIDYQTGQLNPATNDVAVLFKDALITLVTNTNTARLQLTKIIPGRKTFVVTQADPQTNGNAYQITLQSKFLKQIITIYTFLYNVDQNTLYYYNQGGQNWIPEVVQGSNAVNLNNCLALGKFNIPNVQVADVPSNNNQQTVDNNTDNAAIDTSVTASNPPPALPDYDQPECPQDGYLWQPGYWAYSLDSRDYYWVPGVWVAPPAIGFLWTPPYWGFDGGIYIFHTGYWGNTIGFYGGINYGFGYQGVGFVGGEWHGGLFRYNTAVLRVSVGVHNTYVNERVINHDAMRSHYSFNGRGGMTARPTAGEMQAMHERHIMATPEQIRNQRVARADRSQFASSGGGKPGNLAAARAPERGPNNNQRQSGQNGMGSRHGGQGAMGNGNGAQGGQETRPGTPGTQGGGNGTQGGQGTRPGAPGTQGAGSGTPGTPGVRPGAPGVQGAGNGTQGARPGTPGMGPRVGSTPVTTGQKPGAPAKVIPKPKPAPPAKTDKKP